MHAERFQIDPHHHVGVERLTDSRVVDPGVLVDPPGDLVLTDDAGLADVLLDQGADGAGQLAGGSGIAELKLDDRLADHRDMLPFEPLVFRWGVLGGDEISRREER